MLQNRNAWKISPAITVAGELFSPQTRPFAKDEIFYSKWITFLFWEYPKSKTLPFSVDLRISFAGINFVQCWLFMEDKKDISPQQMKEALNEAVGAKFPLKITRKDGQVIVCYIRGFADLQTNIILISETPESVGLKIQEIKDIRIVEIPEKDSGVSRTLYARWLK